VRLRISTERLIPELMVLIRALFLMVRFPKVIVPLRIHDFPSSTACCAVVNSQDRCGMTMYAGSVGLVMFKVVKFKRMDPSSANTAVTPIPPIARSEELILSILPAVRLMMPPDPAASAPNPPFVLMLPLIVIFSCAKMWIDPPGFPMYSSPEEVAWLVIWPRRSTSFAEMVMFPPVLGYVPASCPLEVMVPLIFANPEVILKSRPLPKCEFVFSEPPGNVPERVASL